MQTNLTSNNLFFWILAYVRLEASNFVLVSLLLLVFLQFVHQTVCSILSGVLCILYLSLFIFIFVNPLCTKFTHCMFSSCHLAFISYRINLICNILVVEVIFRS